MHPPAAMTKALFGEDEHLWRVARAKSPSIIRAFHMNGFELFPVFDTKTKEDIIELRAIPKNIEGISVDDLVELVREIAKVCDKDALSIPSSSPTIRPSRIANYFVSEANLLTRDDMGEVTIAQARELLDKFVSHHKDVHAKKHGGDDSKFICCECPHGKQIFQFISSIPSVE